MRRVVRSGILRVDANFRVGGLFVRVGDARELRNDSGARLRVKAFRVALLADVERSRDVHQEKVAVGFDHSARLPAGPVEGSDDRADSDGAAFRDFGSDEANPANIDVAVLS